jgi:GT2 family glycosyltransferase
MTSPQATLVVTTKNRVEELRRALTSAIAQTGVTLEIVVIDDGSSDGTSTMVKTEFPTVRLEHRKNSLGLIVRRNEGARLAAGKILFSIDDDAEFISPDTVARILDQFDHDRIGAVAIPFVNVRQSPKIYQQAGIGGAKIQVTERFIGTAHALRRDLFLRLGGYREHFIHQGEEGDYCLRLLAAGYVVRLGCCQPISHYESIRRDTRRMDYYGRRNDILYAWHNVPMPYLVLHIAGTCLNGLKASAKAKHPTHMLKGMFAGLVNCLRHLDGHKPVSKTVYLLSRKLKKKSLSISDIIHL